MVEFVDEAELGYLRSRTPFAAGAGFAMDEGYRLAHLPLVAPDHPKVIAAREGKDYRMGRHGYVHSLVLPIPEEQLAASGAYQQLVSELKASAFAGKIAWDIVERRAGKLHATIAGGYGAQAPDIHDLRMRAAGQGSVVVELRGIFSGNVNCGRLYLRAYPERRSGENMFHALQRRFGRPTSDLYVVGLWNLRDDLDAAEAAELAAMIDRWWSRPLLSFEASELWLLRSADDLVLDSDVVARLPL